MILLDKKYLLLFLTLFYIDSILAETIYVTDELRIGLHAEKTLSSPILRIVTSGTPLELIKTEEQLSYIREPGGIEGWVDNSYLSESGTGAEKLLEAQTRIKVLEETLAGNTRDGNTTSNEDMTVLEQQLRDEQILSNELQSQISVLSNQIAQVSDTDSLYEKIEQLSRDKDQLETQLVSILEAGAGNDPIQSLDTGGDPGYFNTRNLIIFFAVILIIGLVLGISLMDFINRRRHGGFRV